MLNASIDDNNHLYGADSMPIFNPQANFSGFDFYNCNGQYILNMESLKFVQIPKSQHLTLIDDLEMDSMTKQMAFMLYQVL